MKCAPLGHYKGDWGVTCIEMYCANTTTWHRSACNGGGSDIVKECPANQRICGYRALQVWGKGPDGDAMGMTGLDFHCCYYRATPPADKAPEIFDGDESWNSTVLMPIMEEIRRLEDEKLRQGG